MEHWISIPLPTDNHRTPQNVRIIHPLLHCLARSLFQEFKKFTAAAGIRVGAAFGGQSGGGDTVEQATWLLQGVDVVVAVPGRLIDFVEAEVVSLRRITYFVLDECDHMLEQGFQYQLTSLTSQVTVVPVFWLRCIPIFCLVVSTFSLFFGV